MSEEKKFGFYPFVAANEHWIRKEVTELLRKSSWTEVIEDGLVTKCRWWYKEAL